MRSKSQIRPNQSTLLYAAVLTLVGFLVPFVQKVLLPLQYLNTHLHEFSHALVAQITGAEVEKIVVNADGSGVTPVAGGSLILIASAGYLGASIIGAVMIYCGRTEKGARITLWSIAAALTFSMIVWVRGDSVGEISGFGWITTIALVALLVKGKPLMFCVQFLGLQQCLNAVRSLFTLVEVSASTEIHSDASILQSATHVPSIVWAVGWSAFSLALVGWTLRRSWAPMSGRAG